ncbi:hypothetical protein JCM14036_07930 [Desulfotomaculum defluvii]
MLRKKTCSVILSLALSCQFIITPMAMADSVDDAINNITKDPSYTKVVDQLGVDSGAVEGFVRDVVNSLDKSKLNNDSYIKGVVTEKLVTNETISDAIISLEPSQYSEAKDAVLGLGRTLRDELLKGQTTSGAVGGVGEALSSEEFKLKTSGSRASVDSNGKAYIYLSGLQVKEVKETGKALEMQFSDVKLTFSSGALNIAAVTDKEESEFKVRVKQLTDSEIKDLTSSARNGMLYKVAGKIYDLTSESVDAASNITAISSFKGNVTVSLPVPQEYKNSAASGKLKVYTYNEKSKNWELVGGLFNSSSNSISFETKHFSKYALFQEVSATEVLPQEKPVTKKFKDIEGHWAASDIEYMAAQGYVNGVEVDKFQPQALVTRAEFVTMLVNVLGLQGQAEVNFKDVPKGAWYYPSVAMACKTGLAKGNGADTFAPSAPITRQEMAVMLVNAMSNQGIAVQTDTAALATFVDNSLVADWAKPSAAAAYAAKIIKGKPATKGLNFGPRDNTTRAEAVVMLKNFLLQNK